MEIRLPGTGGPILGWNNITWEHKHGGRRGVQARMRGHLILVGVTVGVAVVTVEESWKVIEAQARRGRAARLR
jgi:hypothetical protein